MNNKAYIRTPQVYFVDCSLHFIQINLSWLFCVLSQIIISAVWHQIREFILWSDQGFYTWWLWPVGGCPDPVLIHKTHILIGYCLPCFVNDYAVPVSFQADVEKCCYVWLEVELESFYDIPFRFYFCLQWLTFNNLKVKLCWLLLNWQQLGWVIQ